MSSATQNGVFAELNRPKSCRIAAIHESSVMPGRISSYKSSAAPVIILRAGSNALRSSFRIPVRRGLGRCFSAGLGGAFQGETVRIAAVRPGDESACRTSPQELGEYGHHPPAAMERWHHPIPHGVDAEAADPLLFVQLGMDALDGWRNASSAPQSIIFHLTER